METEGKRQGILNCSGIDRDSNGKKEEILTEEDIYDKKSWCKGCGKHKL